MRVFLLVVVLSLMPMLLPAASDTANDDASKCLNKECVQIKAKGKSGSTWVSALVRSLLKHDMAANPANAQHRRSRCKRDLEHDKHGLSANMQDPCHYVLVLFRDPRDITISGHPRPYSNTDEPTRASVCTSCELLQKKPLT